MNFSITEEIPNLTVGKLEKVSTELSYDFDLSGEYIQLIGTFLIKRDIKIGTKTTEIINKFPIDITIPKKKLQNKSSVVSLHLLSLQLELEGEFTRFHGELELSNIKESVEESVF